MNSPAGHPLLLVTLCPYSTSILLQFRQCQEALYLGLKTLKRMMKGKDMGAPAPDPVMVDESDESDDSDIDRQLYRSKFVCYADIFQ